MQKIDYGDINKFLVSVGLVLIGLAILVPYLYLKEDFGLYIEQEKLEKMQQPIQELIIDKQCKVKFIQSKLYWISSILTLFGFTTLIWGLVRWFKRQRKIDDRFDKEVTILDIQIESQSPSEKLENISRDLNEIEFHKKTELNETQKRVFKHYLDVENNIAEVFKKYNSPNFDIYKDIRFDGKYDVDILLQAKNSKFSDRIVEIKYFTDSIQSKILKSALNRLKRTVTYYSNGTGRKVVPVFIIVYESDKTTIDQIEIYKKEVKSSAEEIEIFKRLKVEFVNEQAIQNFDVKSILKR